MIFVKQKIEVQAANQAVSGQETLVCGESKLNPPTHLFRQFLQVIRSLPCCKSPASFTRKVHLFTSLIRSNDTDFSVFNELLPADDILGASTGIGYFDVLMQVSRDHSELAYLERLWAVSNPESFVSFFFSAKIC